MAQRNTPSVPISVYRELSAELQSTKATVDSLRIRNDQLAQQNHQLRQEIQNFVQFSVQLGHMTGVAPAKAHPTSQAAPETVPLPANLAEVDLSEWSPPASEARPLPFQQQPHQGKPRQAGKGGKKGKPPARTKQSAKAQQEEFGGPSNPEPLNFPKMRESLYTEQPSSPQRSRESGPTQSRDLSPLWLVLSIVVIVSTAFGAGFLIMKPLLNNR